MCVLGPRHLPSFSNSQCVDSPAASGFTTRGRARPALRRQDFGPFLSDIAFIRHGVFERIFCWICVCVCACCYLPSDPLDSLRSGGPIGSLLETHWKPIGGPRGGQSEAHWTRVFFHKLIYRPASSTPCEPLNFHVGARLPSGHIGGYWRPIVFVCHGCHLNRNENDHVSLPNFWGF